MDESEAIKIRINICRALELISKSGTIHRDKKPGILLSKHGDYKLAARG
jgi:serine/threonine protein kinase